ncbi:hypothetical protein [Basilea psittacipulmonis]|uniref:CRISPR type III A-associated protein Csm5 n=1 Tax=Basilea psittacipulmonis DSM 24701 TaxID=1072685 RepID=A0A077DFE6_9BURK|nr:hypothetical protein [Basilea psittacipulmonis]AIL32871.1 hypothetical protein IX83_05655 [Basilea psittacipulmonis DSM 24701]
MNPISFFKHYQFYITPISPIHMGNGEDFEPINYVLDYDENVLYGFDPSHIKLPEIKRNELLDLVNSANPSIASIQRFFYTIKDKAKKQANYLTLVSRAVKDDFEKKIGKEVNPGVEDNIYNQLQIERTSYHPMSHLPFIPASGFKGAWMTAILDYLSKKDGVKKINDPQVQDQALKKHYLGDFGEGIGVLLKPADFNATSMNAQTKVQYIVNRSKKDSKADMPAGIPIRRECIESGQYRAFSGEVVHYDHPKKQSHPSQKRSFNEMVRMCNVYYRRCFDEEYKFLVNQSYIDQNWLKSVKSLLKNLNQAFDNAEMMLIRLGRNTGAESKTYSDKSMRQIEVKTGKNTFEKLDHTTSIWLASDKGRTGNHSTLPLGWAIVEINPSEENSLLASWSLEHAPKVFLDREKIMTERREQQQQERENAQRQEAERLAREAEENAMKAEREKMQASLNEHQKSVYELKIKFEDATEVQMYTNSPLFKEFQTLLAQATAPDSTWTAEDKAFMAEQLTYQLMIKKAVKFQGMNERDFRKKFTNKLKN